MSNLEPLDKLCPVQNQLLKPASGPDSKLGIKPSIKQTQNKPNSIVFLRRRALYARPAINAQGQVRFGLKHDRMYLMGHGLARY